MMSLLVSLVFTGLAATTAERLDDAHQPFVDDFGAAEGRVRLVAVLSPT